MVTADDLSLASSCRVAYCSQHTRPDLIYENFFCLFLDIKIRFTSFDVIPFCRSSSDNSKEGVSGRMLVWSYLSTTIIL